MDHLFDRIHKHLENCLLQSGIFERVVEGSQLFDIEMVKRANAKWLVIAAGIDVTESDEFIQKHRRDRATIPMQITPQGQGSVLLIVRPIENQSEVSRGKFITKFSEDVGEIEIYQGSYIRIDNIDSPVIQQIRWELDVVQGHKDPIETWLRPWARIVGCNPAHSPSHWHINSPPIEVPARRGQSKSIRTPELRMATGLPNPLLLLLSVANWLKSKA
jgi:hypothetical protein